MFIVTILARVRRMLVRCLLELLISVTCSLVFITGQRYRHRLATAGQTSQHSSNTQQQRRRLGSKLDAGGI